MNALTNIASLPRILVLFGVFAFSLSAHASVISPVSVTSSSTFFSYDEADLINGAGLTGSLHGTDYFTMWLNNAEGAGGTLTFDLGGMYDVESTDIWQYNATCCGLNRGVKDLDVYSSSDGIAFGLVGSGTLAISSGGMIAAETIAFTALGATHIRFDILSNYGNSTYTGLSEVRFAGEEASSVPEPTTIALLGLGLAGLGFRVKKKKLN